MVFRSITTTALSKFKKCRIYADCLRMYSGVSSSIRPDEDLRPHILPPPSLMRPPFVDCERSTPPEELGTNLMQDSKSLNPMFMLVQHLRGGSCNYSALSMQNNSFKPLQSGDNHLIPNFSRLTKCESTDVVATFYSWWLFWAQLKEPELVTYHLWNPSTDEFKTLAPFEIEPRLPNFHNWDHMLWGVGFDSASQDHKVIRGTRIDYYDTNEHNEDDPYFNPTTDWSEFEAEVLSLKTGV
ncbi:F-box protein [Striga asiatica]|uniref:F-box protein n=1 Tax=Striga asiatica TaxID=4170 RepID=A0A5A7P986_STRAF|nr:F-box protein [Striga asiatica]